MILIYLSLQNYIKLSMEFSAEQLAKILGGTVEGDGKVTVSNYAKIEEGKPGTISFLSNPKYEHYIYTTNAGIVLVNNDFVPKQEIKATLIRVPDAYMALAQLLKLAENKADINEGISELAFVSKTAKIAEGVCIAPFAFIGENVTIGENSKIFPGAYLGSNVKVGKDCIIYPNVSIYRDCVVGNRAILHSSCVIGADGFGFAKDETGAYVKMPQNGNVVLGDDVEVGASSTIDRGSMGSTLIANGVKIDNQVQIAHNVELGESTAIAACCGVAGSAKLGRNCVLAGKVGVIGHMHMADGCVVAAGSQVKNSIKEPGAVYYGYPALPINNARRSYAVYKNLPEMAATVNSLVREIEELKKQIQELTLKNKE